MKRTVLLLTLAVILMPVVTSCIEKQGTVGTLISGFMTGYTDSEGYVTLLKDDFGTEYTVSNKSNKLAPDTLYRMVASVILNEDKTARIGQMVPTLSYRAPADSTIPDSIKVTDPAEIISMYIGGGYINIYLGIKVSKEDTAHRLLYSQKDSIGKKKFTIYHNAYGDLPVYTKHAYLSIPLQGYGLSKNDTVFLSCSGYKEDYERKLVIR